MFCVALHSDIFEFDATLPSSTSTNAALSDQQPLILVENSLELPEDGATDKGDQVMDVLVPEGCCAGDLVAVDTPDGTLEVVVPEGLAEGESFQVTTPR